MRRPQLSRVFNVAICTIVMFCLCAPAFADDSTKKTAEKVAKTGADAVVDGARTVGRSTKKLFTDGAPAAKLSPFFAFANLQETRRADETLWPFRRPPAPTARTRRLAGASALSRPNAPLTKPNAFLLPAWGTSGGA